MEETVPVAEDEGEDGTEDIGEDQTGYEFLEASCSD